MLPRLCSVRVCYRQPVDGIERIHFTLFVASDSLAREIKYLSDIEASLRLNSQLEE